MPSGQWVIMAVEMPIHAGFHGMGNGEVGMYNNLYAVYTGTATDSLGSLFGRIWVKLTHWENTWTYFDPVSLTPYDAIDTVNSPTRCPTGDQYSNPNQSQHVPFYYYHCSETGSVAKTAACDKKSQYSDKLRGARMGDFKWKHFTFEIIISCVRWYCKYSISYRDLEEMMLERGISVDHTTLF